MSEDISSGGDAIPSPAEQFANKGRDLDATFGSVVDAASVSSGLWLSYVFVLIYIGVAAGAVTDEDLLRESAIKLPFVGDLPLPLLAFFLLAPIVFVATHAYALVYFGILAKKVSVLETELEDQLGGAVETGDDFRWRLPSNIFVQIVSGPADIREGRLGLHMRFIAWMSWIAAPILLLLLIQVKFLPFHSQWVSWWHRCVILVDLALLWVLWPPVIGRKSDIKRPRPWRYPLSLLATLGVLWLAFVTATFPGESLNEFWRKRIGEGRWIPPAIAAWLGQQGDESQPTPASLQDLLFHGKYDEARKRRVSVFSNTLVLPEFDASEAAKIDDASKLPADKYTLVLRGRHLEGAVFRGANLPKANLENAYLEGATFYQARLQGVSAYGADLRGADLYQAKLQGASLDSADLKGAWMLEAELQGARIYGADMRGATLDKAQLQGATLDRSQLQGASLEGAQLQGASFGDAYLWEASPTDDLTASFRKAATETESIRQAIQAEGYSSVYRFERNAAGPLAAGPLVDRNKPWTKQSFVTLQESIEDTKPLGERPNDATGKMKTLALSRREFLDADMSFENWSKTPVLWARTNVGPINEAALAVELRELVCSGDADAGYVVRGLMEGYRIQDTGDQTSHLVDLILSPDCPVSVVLTEQDKHSLKMKVKRASAK